ncbi:dynamin family protein [Tenggerimyces flavus]|uniref:Dynamin family protein n=1 Tax=Tenggerimyces flavus TaxID=1708749 RepID=A0ABV7YN41_9ACTN|nr:dynamin family protein [Tenggerimyces flavus]MBM7789555.1 energy-coupling factor transporter ATP-binding protein EcfA2 [Tenggerimyces flavus]
MTESGGLYQALVRLHACLENARLPLQLPDVDEARRLQREMASQIRDYALPRLARIEAPLLAVVGGSTGAGKSTLVNTLVGRRVSETGVLRPTTRSPVVVHNPKDAEWFSSGEILPDLPRSTGAEGDPGSLRLVPEKTIPQGLAILDAPDIDSVVTANRDLAAQLLAAADLWLFVTSATRYADAVPWGFLKAAAERSAAVAVVLDRVPEQGKDDIRKHLAQMLAERGLGKSPLFAVPESDTDRQGLLPPVAVAPVKSWLGQLAGDAAARAQVVRQTLDGAVRSFAQRTPTVADALDAQLEAVKQLREDARQGYAAAVDVVDDASKDGSMLRGEVLARWQEFVGTGEIMRSLEAQIGRIRDRIAAAIRGRPKPGEDLTEALGHGLEAVIQDAADHAAERVEAAWRANPAGRPLLSQTHNLAASSPELKERAAEAVRAWQVYLLDLVGEEGQSKRTTARFLSFGVNGLGLVLMIVVFAHTGGLSGAEAGIAGGTSILAQRILEAVFGDQAVRDLTTKARDNLRDRVRHLMDRERGRYDAALDGLGLTDELGTDLREAAKQVGGAR